MGIIRTPERSTQPYLMVQKKAITDKTLSHAAIGMYVRLVICAAGYPSDLLGSDYDELLFELEKAGHVVLSKYEDGSYSVSMT